MESIIEHLFYWILKLFNLSKHLLKIQKYHPMAFGTKKIKAARRQLDKA